MRIEVFLKDECIDLNAKQAKDAISSKLGLDLSCDYADVYTIEDNLQVQEVEKIAKEILIDPVIHTFSINKSSFENCWRFEVYPLSGVEDHISKTAENAVYDAFGMNIGIHHSRLYSVLGDIERVDAEIISTCFYNPSIEHCFIFGPLEPVQISIPKTDFKADLKVESILLPVSEPKLKKLSDDRLLNLSGSELRVIRRHFRSYKIANTRKRMGLDGDINDVELEAIAKIWGEKSSHKIFNAKITYKEGDELHSINSLFRTFIQGATEGVKKPYVLSAFRDHGGIIKFNPQYDVAIKTEISESISNPYADSFESVLRTQRHVLGTGIGSNPIALIDVLSVGPINAQAQKTFLLDAISGIADAGDKTGVPVVNGSITFEDSFSKSPLFYCGGIGLLPSLVGDKPSTEKEVLPGFYLVIVGGKIGFDGIKTEKAVQLADATHQKMLIDFIIDARDNLLYTAITDNGIGGLSNSINELAAIAGGCKVKLDKCSLKSSNLYPWQILVSESLDGMSLAVSPQNIDKLKSIALTHGINVEVIGEFNNSGAIEIYYNSTPLGYLDINFLHEGLPQIELDAIWTKKSFPKPDIKEPDLLKILKMLLSSSNISSREKWIRSFNLDVGARGVVKPKMFSPPDAAVMRVLHSSDEGIVISNGICPKYVQDGYTMASIAFDEAVRNAIAAGAKFGYLAALDNFSWPNSIQSKPDGKYYLAQLVRSCIALYDCSTNYAIPIISGKDNSCANDSLNLLVTIIGKIEDVKNAITPEFRQPGDNIYLLGETKDELGGSEYYKLFGGIGDNPPKVDFDKNSKLYKALSSAIEEKLVHSCHDISDGGFAVALAEMSFPSGLGLDVDISSTSVLNEDIFLFSETPGRFVVCVSPNSSDKFEELLKGCSYLKVGRVRGDKRFLIRRNDRILINSDLENLENAWRN